MSGEQRITQQAGAVPPPVSPAATGGEGTVFEQHVGAFFPRTGLSVSTEERGPSLEWWAYTLGREGSDYYFQLAVVVDVGTGTVAEKHSRWVWDD